MAADAFLKRVPTPDKIAADSLDGTFASPYDISAFDQSEEARAIDVGRQVLRAAGWLGRKDL